jgi:hypothetical protein
MEKDNMNIASTPLDDLNININITNDNMKDELNDFLQKLNHT